VELSTKSTPKPANSEQNIMLICTENDDVLQRRPTEAADALQPKRQFIVHLLSVSVVIRFNIRGVSFQVTGPLLAMSAAATFERLRQNERSV
jgi:hypothetical protein